MQLVLCFITITQEMCITKLVRLCVFMPVKHQSQVTKSRHCVGSIQFHSGASRTDHIDIMTLHRAILKCPFVIFTWYITRQRQQTKCRILHFTGTLQHIKSRTNSDSGISLKTFLSLPCIVIIKRLFTRFYHYLFLIKETYY